jgi:hypothetical protein
VTKRLALLGFLLLFPYAYALGLRDLRKHTVEFVWAFILAFGVYALAVWWVLQEKSGATTTTQLALIFAFGIAFRAILVFSQPKLSDDMYRYVWNGRVQANDINPYLYAPDAPELTRLRDHAIWRLINRKSAVTVYPAGAELAYAAIWRIWPDNVRWFQVVMAGGDLLAGALLAALLRALGRSPMAVLIYLWSPLVIFETAHSAHVDGLVLPLLVGAWYARLKGRDATTGLLLGGAAALKLYPALLLPVLWRGRDGEGSLRPALALPLAFMAGFLLPYLPYLSAGSGVIGYLPNYLKEKFNPGLAYFISEWVKQAGGSPAQVLLALLLVVLAVIFGICILRPPIDGESAIKRCIWPIGTFTLLTQNLFPWYLLWLVPLLAIALPASTRMHQSRLGQLPLNSWGGWWLFSGLVALSYTFFIAWKPMVWASWAQFLPLYAFLLFDLARWLNKYGGTIKERVKAQATRVLADR